VPDIVDPRGLDPGEWQQIGRVMVDLYLFVALALNAALAGLVGLAVLPSLAASSEVAAGVLRWRPWVLSLAGVSVVLMVVALVRGLGLASVTIPQIYPRFGL
jgi:DNA-binding transcriptional LysR family regulator